MHEPTRGAGNGFFLIQLYYFNRTERLIVERAVNHYEKRFQLHDEHRFPAWIKLERNRAFIDALMGESAEKQLKEQGLLK